MCRLNLDLQFAFSFLKNQLKYYKMLCLSWADPVGACINTVARDPGSHVLGAVTLGMEFILVFCLILVS